MKKLIVENGTTKGLDMRAVYALIATLVMVGGIAVALVGERVAVVTHVATGDAEMSRWVQHRLNADGLRHLSQVEYDVLLERRYVLREINTRLSRIEKHFGIEQPVRGNIGPDLVPPGEDD